MYAVSYRIHQMKICMNWNSDEMLWHLFQFPLIYRLQFHQTSLRLIYLSSNLKVGQIEHAFVFSKFLGLTLSYLGWMQYHQVLRQ
jgi:hypothetical protein